LLKYYSYVFLQARSARMRDEMLLYLTFHTANMVEYLTDKLL